MYITKILLKNFRCFENKAFTFDAPFVVIQGNNGAGKTSLFEALHYSCYLRSFRTHLNRDLIRLGSDHFFVQVDVDIEQEMVQDNIQIGYSEKDGKLVKLNKKPIKSYRQIVDHYRIISLAADNIQLVSGAPTIRREFLNYSLLFAQPTLLTNLKRYKTILEQRNSVLGNLGNRRNAASNSELMIWSQKLWEESVIVQRERIAYLRQLEEDVNALLNKYFTSKQEALSVELRYSPKKKLLVKTFDDFWGQHKSSGLDQELRWQRSQYGIHLDDMHIAFQDKKARIFASRGQQKLIVFLIKVAQLQQTLLRGERGVLLLDDFLTDFDENRVARCLKALADLDFQVFISTPVQAASMLDKQQIKNDLQIISL